MLPAKGNIMMLPVFEGDIEKVQSRDFENLPELEENELSTF